MDLICQCAHWGSSQNWCLCENVMLRHGETRDHDAYFSILTWSCDGRVKIQNTPSSHAPAKHWQSWHPMHTTPSCPAVMSIHPNVALWSCPNVAWCECIYKFWHVGWMGVVWKLWSRPPGYKQPGLSPALPTNITPGQWTIPTTSPCIYKQKF